MEEQRNNENWTKPALESLADDSAEEFDVEMRNGGAPPPS